MSSEFENWCEKHRAGCFADLKGQDLIVNDIKKFFSSFPKDKKALLLHGPTGVGKTSLAHIIKNEFKLEMFELNASDFRNKEQLESKLKPASEQKSLFKKGKVLLIDEVDGLSAYSDHGGLPELVRLIEETKFPMIITANDIWDSKFNDLRKKCKVINLKELDYKTIFIILQEIAKKENLKLDNQILISIAVRAKGDARAAINDLQIIASDNDLVRSYSVMDERNKQTDIFAALKFVFKNMLSDETLKIYDSVDIPLDKIFLWVEENIPYEYSGEELYKAYDILSIADVYRGRIMTNRHWRFLIYENIFLSAGISLSKSKPKMGFTHYQKPSRILKIWMSNNKNVHRKSIIEKYAAYSHMSKKKAAREFNFMKALLKSSVVQKELKLNEQEVEWIGKGLS